MKTKAELAALPDGVHDLSREEYDALPERVNFSTLKWMERSPAHYLHQLTVRDDKDTDARQRGRAVSMAVYEPERFRAECVVYEGGPRKGKDWNVFLDNHPDAEILTPAMHAAAVAIAQAARSCGMARPFLSGGRGEQTLLWTHVVPDMGSVPGYSVRCKGRLDFIANVGAIVDLKNSKDASPLGFGRQVVNYFSDVQAAFYADGFKAATGRELPYVIIAVEPVAPYVTQVYQVPAAVLQRGREKYMGWLDRLNVCRRDSDWPGYASAPMELEIPRWAMPNNEDELQEEAA